MQKAPMSSEIELVIFDMDGVLAHLDRRRRLALLAQMTGKTPTFLHETIWASDFESRAEAGAYPTGEEYLAEFNRRTGCRLTREQWIRARRVAMTPIPETLRVAEAVQQQTGIALLTNNGSLLREALPEILPDVSRVFGERAHASFEFNARKPQPLVFERLLARYGVQPSRTLFVDDDEAYIAGAHSVGINAILYINPGELRRSLRRFGLRSD